MRKVKHHEAWTEMIHEKNERSMWILCASKRGKDLYKEFDELEEAQAEALKIKAPLVEIYEMKTIRTWTRR